MNKLTKSKYIKNNLLGKCLVDLETGEIEEINIVSKKEFISIKTKPFMRLFDNKQLKQDIYKILGDYTKYYEIILSIFYYCLIMWIIEIVLISLKKFGI